MADREEEKAEAGSRRQLKKEDKERACGMKRHIWMMASTVVNSLLLVLIQITVAHDSKI